MKTKLIIYILVCFILFDNISEVSAQGNTEIKQLQCVTEADYQKHIAPLLKESYSKLMQEGKLRDKKIDPELNAKVIGVGDLQWPLRMAAHYVTKPGVYDYFQIFNYADLNTAEGPREDWMCNTGVNSRNYDNHNGVDIVPLPFRWEMMDNENVDVIAAADGEVLYLDDGNFDRNCGDEGHILGDLIPFEGYGNFVALLHDDNSVTLYGHMKNGTVATLAPGDEVVAGQYLGKIGSSGNSSDPHLHFEVRNCEACSYFEPWFDAAGCNTDVVASWWADQRPYYEPQILRLMTAWSLPLDKTCFFYESGENENVYDRNHFNSGDNVLASVAIRDFLVGDVMDIAILNSSGVIQESWNIVGVEDNIYGWVFNDMETMTGDPNGTYRLRVIHDGKTYNHYFTIGCTATYTLSGAITGNKGWIAGDNINSTATISGISTNDVFYEAENYVQLNPGFTASSNSKLHVRIDDCTVPGIRQDEPIIKDDDYAQMNIYPNPNFGNFDLHYYSEVASDKYFVMRNLFGEIIYTSAKLNGVNEFFENISLTEQPKGMYFIEFHNGEQIEIEKVVIQ